MTHPTTPDEGAWISASAPAADKNAIRLTATAGAVEIEAAAATEDGKPARPRKFTMTAYTGGAMSVGAYYDPVVVDLSGLDVGNSARPILIDHEHDLEHVLGQTTGIEVKGGKLLVSGNVYGDSETARQVIALNDKGFAFQASIGARVTNREYVPAGSTVRVNGKTFNGPINVARKSVLGEVSFVVLGADDNTSASIAANHAAERKAMGFQEWLAAMGLSLDGLTDEQRTKLEAKYNAEQQGEKKTDGGEKQPEVKAKADDDEGDADPAAQALADVRAKRATDVKRLGALEVLAEKYKGENVEASKVLELHEKAITAGWDADKFELELLRAKRPPAPKHAPNAIVAGGGNLTDGVIEAGFAMAARLEDVEKRFDAKTLEAADKRFRRSISIQEVLLEAAWANGYTGRNFKSDPRAVLRHAFDIQASGGASSINVSGILSNTANKFLLEGFSHVENSWQQIAATRPVSDFKTITSYRMTGALQYEKVAPDGSIRHGTLDQESFTNAADTYGLMLAITRKDIINDDLGAFTAVPRRLGRGAALKLNDVFWTAFLNNSSFFTSGRNNLVSGATYVLGAVGLTEAVKTFRKQVDADGKPLGVEPKILLVGPENEVTADELYTSTNNNTGGAATTAKVPNRNVFAGKYRPVVSAYLSNSSYTGYSATAYYLLADPADLPVVEVAFLNGQQSPTVETADADFSTLGIQLRGYHDFGVSLQDYRGGVKVAGA